MATTSISGPNMSPEHHVMNCIFHNHDEKPNGKLLGGISFDSGASSDGGKKHHTVIQAGGQSVQPPFSNMNMNRVAGFGISASGQGAAGNKAADGSRDKRGHIEHATKDTLSITTVREDNKIACVTENVQQAASHRRRFDYKKYKDKLRNGIHAFLEGMEQKAGKEKKRQSKEKKTTGTRAVTKEEVYEIQINTAYLLDSYNKYGERSTLGKE